MGGGSVAWLLGLLCAIQKLRYQDTWAGNDIVLYFLMRLQTWKTLWQSLERTIPTFWLKNFKFIWLHLKR